MKIVTFLSWLLVLAMPYQATRASSAEALLFQPGSSSIPLSIEENAPAQAKIVKTVTVKLGKLNPHNMNVTITPGDAHYTSTNGRRTKMDLNLHRYFEGEDPDKVVLIRFFLKDKVANRFDFAARNYAVMATTEATSKSLFVTRASAEYPSEDRDTIEVYCRNIPNLDGDINVTVIVRQEGSANNYYMPVTLDPKVKNVPD